MNVFMGIASWYFMSIAAEVINTVKYKNAKVYVRK